MNDASPPVQKKAAPHGDVLRKGPAQRPGQQAPSLGSGVLGEAERCRPVIGDVGSNKRGGNSDCRHLIVLRAVGGARPSFRTLARRSSSTWLRSAATGPAAPRPHPQARIVCVQPRHRCSRCLKAAGAALFHAGYSSATAMASRWLCSSETNQS